MNTRLDCSVTHCAHNSTGKCTLTDIKIGGPSANTSADTCCSSYDPMSNSGAKNSTNGKTPKESAQIKCEARQCMHNSFGGCAATNIQVESCGCSSNDSSCTQCSTFRM